jgi:hypothetical protein
MAAEMQLHVDLQTELICKAGMNAQEARYTNVPLNLDFR